MRLLRLLPLLIVLVVVAAACESTPTSSASGAPAADGSAPATAARPENPTPTAPPPGHELYGFLPYWEMDGGIAAHLRDTPLTTLGLFSVTHTSKWAINTTQRGYKLITGTIGRQLITEAHDRGTRVELVYSSFGRARNERLMASETRQAKVITALVELVTTTGADGVNVDVETLDPTLVPAYGAFVGNLRSAIRAANPAHQVSASTGAGPLGAAMALAASDAGADRIFLMGYDYRVAASPFSGASAPLRRSDGGERDLGWSLDLYDALGVPRDRLLLGLPLYGMTWPVAGPVIGAPTTGRGDAWIPRRNLSVLLDPTIAPVRDEVEQVDVYFEASDGSWGAPSSAGPSTGGSAAPSVPASSAPSAAGSSPVASAAGVAQDRTWTAIYVDSPATLAPKLALANDRGLAGAGFWAVGYERGLPGYAALMAAFASGGPLPSTPGG